MAFLKNAWYVAANAPELDEGLVSRKICNELIVMYRKADGGIAALEDRCPHRFVPLSMGNRIGDTLQCGYHGLAFDTTGACVDMPNDRGNQVLKPCVKSYAAVERYGVVWLWLGDAKLANPDKIPDFSFITDKEHFASPQGYTHIMGNYELLVDNLLDLSHIHYLHPHVHQGVDFASFKNEVKLDGEDIWSMLWRPDYTMSETRRKEYGFGSGPIDGQGHSRWSLPGVVLVQTAFWERGKGVDDAIQIPSAHLFTPETEFTTHYFWATGHNYDLDNEELSIKAAAATKNIFETQDGPMIEAQQRAMGETTDFLEQSPIILKADAAGVMARRMMKRKIREEEALQRGVNVAAE